jgi:enamine deaminase RidA (YjgF/YER057c/UK114 family)
MTPEAKLASMGLALPELPKPIATYVSFKRHGDTLYLSGQGPRRNDGTMMSGKVGRDVTVEQGYEHAKLVGLGLLAAAKAAAGDLSKIEVLKVLGWSRRAPFTGIPKSSTDVPICSWRCSAEGPSRPLRRRHDRCPVISAWRSGGDGVRSEVSRISV